MKRNLTFPTLAAALVLTLTSCPNFGADTDKRPPSGSGPAVESPAPTPVASPSFNLDIVGGFVEAKPGRKPATVGNLVEVIHERMPEAKANLVLSPGTAEIRVQELRLRSVDLEQFLQALSVATDNRVQWRFAQGIYSLVSRPGPEPQVEVFNLSAYLADALQAKGPADPAQSAKLLGEVLVSVMDMVLSTVEFADQTQADRIMDYRFHPEARLLVVRGTPKAIEVARKVVTALNEPFHRDRVRRDLSGELNLPTRQ